MCEPAGPAEHHVVGSRAGPGLRFVSLWGVISEIDRPFVRAVCALRMRRALQHWAERNKRTELLLDVVMYSGEGAERAERARETRRSPDLRAIMEE